MFRQMRICDYLFAARAIADDDRAAKQPFDNGEGKAKTSHRITVNLSKDDRDQVIANEEESTSRKKMSLERSIHSEPVAISRSLLYRFKSCAYA